jgi:very-short-patch-repair endonuclease
MTLLIFLALAVVIIGTIFFMKASRKPSQSSLTKEEASETISYPYQKQPFLLTKAERSFFGVLQQAVGDDYCIFSKVRLADLIKVSSGLSASDRQKAQNRISGKHVDFVLCNTHDLAIHCVIELDDKSHEKLERRQRDEFVDTALHAAGVMIVHFSVQQTYNINEIRKALSKASTVLEQVKEAVAL